MQLKDQKQMCKSSSFGENCGMDNMTMLHKNVRILHLVI